jgi:DNA-binding transcriptional LysR family regulator
MQICMDWRSVKFDWNRARAFLVTAEEGSLSAAARALGMTQPTLSRQVDALENELSLVLFERAGRGLILTPQGLELLEHVRAMGEAASQLSRAASGQSQSIEGSICIAASEAYSAFLLPPIIEKLRQEYPSISVEVVASNAGSDLLRREADIAIRNFASSQPDLITRKIRDDEGFFYAAHSYLAKLGNPQSFTDLKNADFLAFANNDPMMSVLNAMGLHLAKRNFPIICDNHLVQWQLVKQGVGIGGITSDIGDAEPLVRRILPYMAPIIIPMWLVTHRELNTSKRVRTVFDFLVAELSRKPSQNATLAAEHSIRL